MRPCLTLTATVLLALAPAAADDLADQIEAGRRLAVKFCAECHAIGVSGESPHSDAPPLRQIVAKGNVENLEEALGEGIIVGHPAMPQYQFKGPEVGALIAYLKSLSGRG